MSYGIELRRADGSLALSSVETFARLVHVETLAHAFSGTFSVPAFDDQLGMFYAQFEVTDLTADGETSPGVNVILGSLSWNNATKVMTVAPPVIPAAYFHQAASNYEINFIHFR